MALTKSWGYTDSTQTTSYSIPKVDLSTLRKVVDRSKEKNNVFRTDYINVESPTDQVENVISSTRVTENGYAGTSILPAYYAPSKKGFSSLTQVNDILRISSPEDPSICMDLPIGAHIVLTGVYNAYLSEDDLGHILDRAYQVARANLSTNVRLKEMSLGVSDIPGALN